MKKTYLSVLILVILFVLGSWFFDRQTGVKIQRAFYFWENNSYGIESDEYAMMDSLKIEKLYVKFFEVDRNDVFGIYPTAKSETQIWNNDSSNLQIIPTIYIRNKVFKDVSKKELEDFAENLIFLVNKKYTENYSRFDYFFNEIQIDCDWTESTQENYFTFLKILKQTSSVPISATLRLYAYKFPDKMGYLPVDRAMLMCYNLLQVEEAGNRNSVLDLIELEKYLNGAEPYPLPLDIALPIYSSVHIYPNKQYGGTYYQEDTTFIKLLNQQHGLWYTLKKDTVVNEFYLRKGDLVKYEQTTPQLIEQAIAIIRTHVHLNRTTTVSLFHLQNTELQHHSYENLDQYYQLFLHH